MAHNGQSEVIRRIAVWLGLIRPEDQARHHEAKRVLSEAHDEISQSRRARAEIRRDELQLRVEVKTRR